MKNVRSESSTYPLAIPPATVSSQAELIAPPAAPITPHENWTAKQRFNELSYLPQQLRELKAKVEEVQERVQSGINSVEQHDKDIKQIDGEITILLSGQQTTNSSAMLTDHYQKRAEIRASREKVIRKTGAMKKILVQHEANLAAFPFDALNEYLEGVKREEALKEIRKQFKNH